MEEQQSDMELDSERVPVPQVQQPSVGDSHIEPSNKITGISRGKPRLRKKALHAAILKQMEFYFSDANLTKDRFLGTLIQQNPYVDLSVFIRFNRIRDLTTDTSRIAKALQKSTVLLLSEDGTKVCRTTPVVQKENIDDCTIYVQNLPPDADHEVLSSIFAQYGTVAYVSVPRYKSNKKIKGFAFVEFDKPESAQKCIKSFQKKGCVLPSHTSPNELLSITTFDDVEKDVTLAGKPLNFNTNNGFAMKVAVPASEDNTESSNCGKEEPDVAAEKISESDENKEKIKAKKRKHQSTEESSAETSSAEKDVPTSKKKKAQDCDGDTNNELICSNDQKNESTTKDEQTSNENINTEDTGTAINSVNEEQENATDDKKKKRKRKRRSKIEDVGDSMGLQVMTKRDWKHLRNKYLELQRSKMKQLKQHLKKTRWNQWSNYERNKFEKEENDEKEKTAKDENASANRFSFAPGVIVKIEMQKPCTDPKSFKMELRGNSSVKYIDVQEGSYDAYVRCDTTEAAQALAQKSTDERHMTVLQDKEETMYWQKISQDREEKINNKVRIKQRGRNKLLKKAEKELGKHIKFDEV